MSAFKTNLADEDMM